MAMDMDGMDMSSMTGQGMDMSSDGMFKGTNMSLARLYWYFVAGVVALLGVRRVIDWSRTRSALKIQRLDPAAVPSRPGNIFYQTLDTATATCREMAYPQLYWAKNRLGKYFNPPALGRCLLLLTYWVIILIFLWSNTILKKSSSMYAYKWEIVGFRAAWVSVTQLPLIYCLSSKFSVISMITGISYERLNWLHRWVSRTLFLTIIVHWSFFFREWTIADFVKLEMQMMPMVKWGFASWGIIGWMVLSGFGFFRALSYELWVLQHMAAAFILLWTVHKHVPSYAAYNVWLAVGFVVLDRSGRTLLAVFRNLHFQSTFKTRRLRRDLVGFSSRVELLPNEYIHMTVDDVDFAWGAGQHIYVSLPHCGPFQFHPFTIANDPSTCVEGEKKQIRLYFKAHSGFTKRVLKHCLKANQSSLRCFIAGPYGNPPLPVVERADSLILIATSTGASFTLPFFQHAVNTPSCARRICFFWIVRHTSQLNWHRKDILLAVKQAKSNGVHITTRAFVTGSSGISTKSTDSFELDIPSSTSATKPAHPTHNHQSSSLTQAQGLLRSTSVTSTSTASTASSDRIYIQVQNPTAEEKSPVSPPSYNPTDITDANRRPKLPTSHGRPSSLDALIRPTVEASYGETAILACGGGHFMAEIRNYVAKLSDERAVHKGTGAQGIYLFTETYGW